MPLPDLNPHKAIQESLAECNSDAERIDYLAVAMGNIMVLLEIILEDMPASCQNKLRETLENNLEITIIR